MFREQLQVNKNLLNQVQRIPLSNQLNYKQRASALFAKLNSFKTNIQIQKHEKFTTIIDQLKSIQTNLQTTTKDKEEHFQKVIQCLGVMEKEIQQQRNQYHRFQKIFQNIVEQTNREVGNVFDKMNKERENNQHSIEKYIDFKTESFVLKNKGVWLQQDLLNFEPFREQLNYLRKEMQDFYKTQQREAQKLKKQVSESLDKQKEFLLFEMKRTDHSQILQGIELVNTQINKRVSQMTQKRQQVEQNVLQMIQNVVNSYIKDTTKFK